MGSSKLVHHAASVIGVTATALVSLFAGTGVKALPVQLPGVSAFGGTKSGPTVQPARSTPSSTALTTGRAIMRRLAGMNTSLEAAAEQPDGSRKRD